VELDGDVHRIADSLADAADRLQSGLQVSGGDPLAACPLGKPVEWPDLHRRDPLVEQRLRERDRLFVEIVLGVITGVVGGDAVAGLPAEQLVNRLAGQSSLEVPERDVERARRAHLRSGMTVVIEIRVQVISDPLDVPRVLTEDSVGDGTV